MAQGHHHILKHKHIKPNPFLYFMDRGMYIIALIAPIMTIPQLIDVFHGHVQGVSLLTWGAYAVVSGLWLVYGFFHKDKPLMLTQFLLLVLDGSIVFFVLLFR